MHNHDAFLIYRSLVKVLIGTEWIYAVV